MQSGSTVREFARVKHGEQPGQISRRHIIRMREKRLPFSIQYGGGYYHHIDEKGIKTLRRYLNDKSKTVQRRRDKRMIRDQSDY